MIRTVQTARKSHRCDANPRGCTVSPGLPKIRRGERYVRIVWPPWTLVREDPEDSPTKLGEWITEKYHPECYPR